MDCVSFVHASSVTLGIVKERCEPALRDFECLHFLDETLLARLAPGDIPPRLAKRFFDLVAAAGNADPRLVVTTCSSYTGLLPAARHLLPVPLIAPDRAMLESAVEKYSSLLLVATLPNAVKAAAKQIEDIAQSVGKVVRIEPVVAQGAMQRLREGDRLGHDEAVLRAVKECRADAEAVVLCQFTLGHLSSAVRESIGRPAFSGLDSIVEIIRALAR